MKVRIHYFLPNTINLSSWKDLVSSNQQCQNLNPQQAQSLRSPARNFVDPLLLAGLKQSPWRSRVPKNVPMGLMLILCNHFLPIWGIASTPLVFLYIQICFRGFAMTDKCRLFHTYYFCEGQNSLLFTQYYQLVILERPCQQ